MPYEQGWNVPEGEGDRGRPRHGGMDEVQQEEAQMVTLPEMGALVGDDGEFDPEIYADIASRFPDRVAATLIRMIGGHTTCGN